VDHAGLFAPFPAVLSLFCILSCHSASPISLVSLSAACETLRECLPPQTVRPAGHRGKPFSLPFLFLLSPSLFCSYLFSVPNLVTVTLSHLLDLQKPPFLAPLMSLQP
jgi:hypothetical protein